MLLPCGVCDLKHPSERLTYSSKGQPPRLLKQKTETEATSGKLCMDGLEGNPTKASQAT